MPSDEIIETMVRAGLMANLNPLAEPSSTELGKMAASIRAALSAAQAAGSVMVPVGLVEQAFRDGLAYGNNVEGADSDVAWQQSRVRAMIEGRP